MWGASLGSGLGSGGCLAPHQVVYGAQCVVGVQQGRAQLGHPVTSLAVAIETDADAGAGMRRDRKSQPVRDPGGAEPHLLARPIPARTPPQWSSPPWERNVSGGPHRLPR